MRDRAFPFIRINEREGKPRTHGITEKRGSGENQADSPLLVRARPVIDCEFAVKSRTQNAHR